MAAILYVLEVFEGVEECRLKKSKIVEGQRARPISSKPKKCISQHIVLFLSFSLAMVLRSLIAFCVISKITTRIEVIYPSIAASLVASFITFLHNLAPIDCRVAT